VSQGIRVAEFPTTTEAAKASKDAGLGVLMGAPNVMRGGSHSGNVSAVDLAQRGFLDGLSSDYVPASLMQAVFQLAGSEGIALPKAVAMVSANPAEMVNLADRGEIAPTKRADFSRVRLVDGLPVILGVWREGQRIC
jgi:alpha-D-ribose 1-methylphosphonate 5-triphosphate diphosphatase